jgi:hypothetical protein
MSDDRQCTAHSSQSGERCRKSAMHGQKVCATHGGKAPQNIKAAKERIAAMVDPALGQLLKLATKAESEAVRLGAVRDVLDRAGLSAKQALEVTHHQGTPDLDARIEKLLDQMAERERSGERDGDGSVVAGMDA